MLDAMDLQSPVGGILAVEQAQAWVLVSVYEYMQMSPQQAWMSAGRCCRLVLGMRLYEIDDPNNPVTMAREHEPSLVDWTGLEEQRRTFWMAYSLDRFISFHNALPYTLNEHLVCLIINTTGYYASNKSRLRLDCRHRKKTFKLAILRQPRFCRKS